MTRWALLLAVCGLPSGPSCASASDRMPPRFAIVGFVDFDRDGMSDLPYLRKMIANNGGVVDAVLDSGGVLEGRLTPRTNYLLMGTLPGDTAPAAAQQRLAAFLDRAKRLQVPQVNLQDLVRHGSRIRAGGADAVEGFRPRRPVR